MYVAMMETHHIDTSATNTQKPYVALYKGWHTKLTVALNEPEDECNTQSIHIGMP